MMNRKAIFKMLNPIIITLSKQQYSSLVTNITWVGLICSVEKQHKYLLKDDSDWQKPIRVIWMRSYGAIMTFQHLFWVTEPDWRWTSLCACEKWSLSATARSAAPCSRDSVHTHISWSKDKNKRAGQEMLGLPWDLDLWPDSDPVPEVWWRGEGTKDPGEGVLGFQEQWPDKPSYHH